MRSKVVIVDDVQAFREEWRAALEEEFEIVGDAADGLQAIDVVRRSQPDIVVMDVVMPKMSGIEACRHILDPANLAVGGHVPKIVIVSGLKDENIVMQAIEAGASDYLFKPVKPEKLRAVLRDFLRSAA